MPTNGAGATPFAPNATDLRRQRQLAFRIAFAATLTFSLGMILSLPLFYIAAAFAAPFAQAPAPMPVRAGVRMLCSMAGLLILALIFASLLLPYPVAFLSAIAISLALSFRYAVRGGDMLITVAALLGALLVPYLMLKSPGLAASTTFWLMVNFTLGLIASWAAFAVFPPVAPAQPAPAPGPAPDDDLDRRHWRICLVSIPFAIVFFVTGSGAFYTLIFVSLLSSELAASTGSGPAAAQGMLRANILGGVVAFIAYESIVIAPVPVVAILATLTMSLFLARRIAVGDKVSGSALTVALLLLGGSMVFSNDADARLIDRIAQIAIAIGYILMAFVLVDRWLPERTRRGSETESDTPPFARHPV
ncbi:MAG: hypothetical protein AAF371_16730 [Pseudomonadota bacterium]